jgi:hypothetical protein
MARSLPQHVPEVLTRSSDSSSGVVVVGSKSTSHSFGGGGGVMNRLHQTTTTAGHHHHLLTGSLSAPSSPSQLVKSSSIPLKMRQSVTRQGAPPPNIIVEKGRIEFVKTSSSTSTTNNPPVETQLPTTEKHKLQMGTKIFRPPSSSCSPSPKKSNSLPESTSTDHQEMPPKGVKSPKESSVGSISFRDRSASPKFNSTRESTPPLPDSKIPSGLMRMKQPTTTTTTPDVVRANHLPRPGFINKSRETSPSPQQQQQQQQSCSSAKPLSSIPSNKCASNNSNGSCAGSVNGAAVPVSPNLIRWRAKLSGSSGPCVTNHLNLNVSAAAAVAAAVAATNNSSIAGSHPKKTPPPSGGASLVKLSGNGAKSCPSSSSSTTSSSKPSTSAPPPPSAPQVNIIQFQFKFSLLFFSFLFLPKLGK